MRLPKHTLPKQSNKAPRTVKHKDSEKHKAKHALKAAKKAAKANTMAVDDEEKEPAPVLTEEEKAAAKKARKLINKPRIYYKQQILNITGRNGPRAARK